MHAWSGSAVPSNRTAEISVSKVRLRRGITSSFVLSGAKLITQSLPHETMIESTWVICATEV